MRCCHSALASSDHLHPIVFLHGVGAGLLPYIPFLLRVAALGRPVMAVEYKHLSMRWTDFIPTAPQVRKICRIGQETKYSGSVMCVDACRTVTSC